MKKMSVLLFVLTLMSFAEVRAEPTGKEEMFTEVKTHALSMIDKRIASLQEEKNCVTQAQNRDDMKKCRKDHQDNQAGFKADREEFRETMKSKREALKKSRKEKKNSASESS